MYVTPFPQLYPQLPMSSRVAPLSSVMVADVSSLLTAMSVTYRPFQEGCVFFRRAVLVEGGPVVGGHVVFSHFCLSWRGGVARSFVAAVYARVAAPRRTVSVKPVP